MNRYSTRTTSIKESSGDAITASPLFFDSSQPGAKENATVEDFSVVQTEGGRNVNRNVLPY
jgi:hypothetical protein